AARFVHGNSADQAERGQLGRAVGRDSHLSRGHSATLARQRRAGRRSQAATADPEDDPARVRPSSRAYGAGAARVGVRVRLDFGQWSLDCGFWWEVARELPIALNRKRPKLPVVKGRYAGTARQFELPRFLMSCVHWSLARVKQ